MILWTSNIYTRKMHFYKINHIKQIQKSAFQDKVFTNVKIVVYLTQDISREFGNE